MSWSELTAKLDWWALLGLFGQAMFMGRFVVQWIASEKKGESVVPVHFWILSLLGSIVVLTYAIGRSDPVFILAQSFGSVVYIRNLMLIRRGKRTCANKVSRNSKQPEDG